MQATTDGIWERVCQAWAVLAQRRDAEKATGPEGTAPPRSGRSEPRPGTGPRDHEGPGRPPHVPDGFEAEALPLLGAVFGFALHLTRGDRDGAEDLVQETFLRAHRFWDRYERGTNIRAWLFTICRNIHRHERQRARNRNEIPASEFDARIESIAGVDAPGRAARERTAWGGPGTSGEAGSSGPRLTGPVARALGELPDKYRDVLILSDLGDLRYEEIAEFLDVPLGTVKSRLSRARRILREAPGILAARYAGDRAAVGG